MLLSDLRGHKALTGSAAGLNTMQTALDAELLNSCSALKDADVAYHEGIQQAGADDACDAEMTMCEVVRRGRERVAVAIRIANTPALSDSGLLGKLSIIERLLPQHYDDPAPARDAVTLSFVADMERLFPATAKREGGAACEMEDGASAIFANARECLQLMDQLADGMARLEDGSLSLEQQEALSDNLFTILQKKRAAAAALAGMTAGSFDTSRAKGRVLRRLLESGWLEDGHSVRVDLAHSYVADVRRLLAEADVGRSATTETSSWWSSIAGRFWPRDVKA
ncbi:hypothetical protein [Roseomonas mucosa]|uniref:hypothetical protein n=1 Tax=Roseomonas mucosa TaxID=207340 RepID=UPI002247E5C1|nr:hypothetical protein [Roseomonas mucosa]UZO94738.1 Hypothetical protein RMP42_05867 [Roseomonas mucosa]